MKCIPKCQKPHAPGKYTKILLLIVYLQKFLVTTAKVLYFLMFYNIPFLAKIQDNF